MAAWFKVTVRTIRNWLRELATAHLIRWWRSKVCGKSRNYYAVVVIEDRQLSLFGVEDQDENVLKISEDSHVPVDVSGTVSGSDVAEVSAHQDAALCISPSVVSVVLVKASGSGRAVDKTLRPSGGHRCAQKNKHKHRELPEWRARGPTKYLQPKKIARKKPPKRA